MQNVVRKLKLSDKRFLEDTTFFKQRICFTLIVE